MNPTLIVTRPAQQGATFAARVSDRYGNSVRVIQSPLLEIRPVPVTQDLSGVAGVIFTSANAVGAVDMPAGLTAWCVGPKTAMAAQKAGFHARTGPGDGAALVAMIRKDGHCGPLAHIRGKHTHGDIAGTLTRAGIICHDVVAYDQTARPLTEDAKTALGGDFPVVLPLFSPRTATILNAQGHFTAPVHVVVISEAVKNALGSMPVASLTVAAQPNGKAMLDATFSCLDGLVNNKHGSADG